MFTVPLNTTNPGMYSITRHTTSCDVARILMKPSHRNPEVVPVASNVGDLQHSQDQRSHSG